MTEFLHKDETYAIQGAIFEVYREMGSGFLEAVYQECLAQEFRLRNIPFSAQKSLSLSYKGTTLEQTYIADFICYENIIVELKAVSETTSQHEAQVFNYIRASNLRVGLLVNFGHYPKATVKRIVI